MAEAPRWTALLLAGSRPGVDPFAAAHGAELKALIPVGGVPMLARPVDALLKAKSIASIRILAQEPERLAAALPDDPRLTMAPSGATIAATLEALLEDEATTYPLLVTTADHALLTPQMVEEFCAAAAGADLAIAMVERANLLARLPQSRRTWLKFRGGAYSGANLFALGSPRAIRAIRLWRSVEQDRKKGWRLIAQLGLPTLLGAVLRLRTLAQTVRSIGRRLGADFRAVEMSDPIACVDVDKQADLILAEQILETRR